MWVVIETYYKYGEYTMKFFEDDNSLKQYIYTRLRIYKTEFEYTWDILALIDHAEKTGNYRVENQEGWGIREIRQTKQMNFNK